MSHNCANCKKAVAGKVRFKTCSRYHAVYYNNHKTICLAIDHLHQKFSPSSRNSQFTSHITPKEHTNLIFLVGSRCLVSEIIDGIAIKGLWDSGSQVSIVSKHWVEKFLVGKKLDLS